MTTIMIYGEIGYWPNTAENIIPQITGSTDALEIRINSDGGYLMHGVPIYNAIRAEIGNGRQVTCYIDGFALSMASLIAIAADTVMMAENGLMMIHSPWDSAVGDPEDMRKKADQLDLLRDMMFKAYAAKANITPEEFRTLIDDADGEMWLNPDQALEMGFITGVLQPMLAAASLTTDLSKFGYRKVPDALRPPGAPPLLAAASATMENGMNPPNSIPAAASQTPLTAAATPTALDVQAAADAAVATERSRIAGVQNLCRQHGIDAALETQMIARGDSIEAARAAVLDALATRTDSVQVGHQPAIVTRDGRDKWMAGAMAGLAHRLGVAALLKSAATARGETLDLDPGEFRGVGMVQLAMESLMRGGAAMNSRDPMAIVGQALTAKASGAAIVQGTGDFPILLENLLRKTLQASYAVTPDTWSEFCGIGSVIDFRTHRRYLRGSFGALDSLTETGEFQNRAIPDGSRESLTATTKGNIIALSRQALVNDDMGAFMALAQDMGRAAKLSIETDVYALLAANPTMSDGIALFNASHSNIGTAGLPTVSNFDEVRRLMASQRDISGNDFLDIRPAHWVGAMSQGGAARVVNGSQYDPTANAGQQRANIALGLFRSITDTPRITGTLWYAFADKTVAPALEVAFLNGVQEPFIDSEQGWRMDGTEWKVRLDYGVAAVNWRSAVRNAGA